MTAATETRAIHSIDTNDEKKHPFSSSGYQGFPPRVIKTDGFERLFSHYTGLHGDALMDHLVDFQSQALKVQRSTTSLIQVHPYSCISNGGFAALRERAHTEYNEIVKYAKRGGQLYLDLGCCCISLYATN